MILVTFTGFVVGRKGPLHLKGLTLFRTSLSDKASTMSQLQKSSPILTLAKLDLVNVRIENSTAASQFLNLMAHVTYSHLSLGILSVENNMDDDDDDDDADNRQRKENRAYAHRVDTYQAIGRATPFWGISAQLKSWLYWKHAQLSRSESGHPIVHPLDYYPAALQHTLQTIALRNRTLARFVAYPRAFDTRGDLLELLRQFNACPTGLTVHCLLDLCLQSFLLIQADPSTTGPKMSAASSTFLGLLGCVVQYDIAKVQSK